MLRIPLLCTTTLVLVALMQAASPQQKDFTRADLLAEYKRLIPINQAMHRGEWPVQNEHYPKTLGTFDSREVQEAFWCGDLCPQYGSVNIIYSNVKRAGLRRYRAAPLFALLGHSVSRLYSPDRTSGQTGAERVFLGDSLFHWRRNQAADRGASAVR
jgi:hypothetical protein